VRSPAFTRGRWRALSPLLDEALEVPPSQRDAWLATFRLAHPYLAPEIERLLQEHDAMHRQRFLEIVGRPHGG
jgi:hypothetical protein